MGVHITEVTWRFIYENLSTNNTPPIHLKLLDTVLFDIIHPFKPQTWVFTNLNGYVDSRNIRNLTIDDILQAFLENMFTGENSLTIHVDKQPRASLFLNDDSRVLADALTLWKICEIYPGGVVGIQLYKVPGIEFDMYYYFHEINSSKTPNESFTRTLIETYDLEEVATDSKVINSMKNASSGIINRLLEKTRLGLHMIKVVYYLDPGSFNVWLVGIERCLLYGDSRMLQNRNKQSLVSIPPQSFVLPASKSEDNSIHLRSKSMPKQLQSKKAAIIKETKKQLKRNLTPSKELLPSVRTSLPKFLGMHFANISKNTELYMPRVNPSPYVDTEKTQSASYKVFPSRNKLSNEQRNIPQSNRGEVLSLPPNNNAFSRAITDLNPPKHLKKSSLSSNFKLEVPKATLVKPYRRLYGTKCYGNYCYEPQIRLLRYDLNERFIVPEGLIKAASTDDYNPVLHKDLFKVPKEVINTIQYYKELYEGKTSERFSLSSKNDISTSLVNSRLILKDQDAFLPVCYRCLVVYYNIEAQLRSPRSV